MLPNKINQSELLNAIRVPLIYLIILIHTHYNKGAIPEMSQVSDYSFYFLTEWLGDKVLYAAVACFFVLSAYYAYNRVPDEGWSQEYYLKLLSKRIPTLLLPFLIWGLLFIGVVWAKNELFHLLGLSYDVFYGKVDHPRLNVPLWNCANGSLWYVRDLMCQLLISPLYYYLFRYLKHWGLLLLIGYYLTGWVIPFTGFTPMAITFFGIGAYLGLYRHDIPELCWRMRYPSLLILLVLPTMVVLQLVEEPWAGMMIRFCQIFGGTVCIVNLFNWLFSRYATLYNWAVYLAPATFFIYVSNEIYILPWVKGLVARLPLMDTLGMRLLGYFATPAIVMAVCYAWYRLMQRYTPRLLAFATGRTQS